ncbi:MAG: hypothetical protein CME64_10155 [Halobacteriovoraceae bacterium]|nr:hypothetical protein [Halobacteriovoraceae bacterium]
MRFTVLLSIFSISQVLANPICDTPSLSKDHLYGFFLSSSHALEEAPVSYFKEVNSAFESALKEQCDAGASSVQAVNHAKDKCIDACADEKERFETDMIFGEDDYKQKLFNGCTLICISASRSLHFFAKGMEVGNQNKNECIAMSGSPEVNDDLISGETYAKRFQKKSEGKSAQNH